MRTRDGEWTGDGTGMAGSLDCAWVRDRLPLLGLAAISEAERSSVDAHLTGCGKCRVEAELVARFQAAAPRPPESIRRGVLERWGVTSHGPSSEALRWAVRSAAVVILALGIGVVWGRSESPDAVWAMVLEPEPPAWYGNEWVVAGQPVPEALPDEVLRGLLEEIEQ